MFFNEMKFLALQLVPQERVVEDFIPMPLFNENNSSLNSQSQSQPITSTPTSVLAPFPGNSSDSQSSSHTLPSSQQTEHERRGTPNHVNHGQPNEELFEDISQTRDFNVQDSSVSRFNHSQRLETSRGVCGGFKASAHGRDKEGALQRVDGPGFGYDDHQGRGNIHSRPPPSNLQSTLSPPPVSTHDIDPGHGSEQNVYGFGGLSPT